MNLDELYTTDDLAAHYEFIQACRMLRTQRELKCFDVIPYYEANNIPILERLAISREIYA